MKTICILSKPFALALVLLLILVATVSAQTINKQGTDLGVTGYGTSELGKSLIRYEITVTNFGDYRAQRVGLTQQLSGVTHFMKVTTDKGSCTGQGTLVQCAVKKLGPGKTMHITVIAARNRVPCAVDCLMPISSKVSLHSMTSDPITGNDEYVITVR